MWCLLCYSTKEKAKPFVRGRDRFTRHLLGRHRFRYIQQTDKGDGRPSEGKVENSHQGPFSVKQTKRKCSDSLMWYCCIVGDHAFITSKCEWTQEGWAWPSHTPVKGMPHLFLPHFPTVRKCLWEHYRATVLQRNEDLGLYEPHCLETK